MSNLRSIYRLCTGSHAAPAMSPIVSAATITAPAFRLPLETAVVNLNMGHAESALDEIELMSIICAVRSAVTVPSRRSHRRLRTSLSPSSEQSRVLRAQGATPIHRSRTSYASRSTSRRIESRGSLGRTLYRLPQLLSFGNRLELQDDSSEVTNPLDEQVSLNVPPTTSVPEATPPSTPKRGTPTTPVAPLTAPAAGTDLSPGWGRWIFNGVSRRWTVLRGRFAHDHDHDNGNDFDDIVESLKVVTSFGGWTSINYFVFPGMTDSVEEYEALRKFIAETGLKMIQWRNFNIDPDWYLGKIGVTDSGEFKAG